MGVYQRAEAWQDFQTKRSVYRDGDDQGLRRRASGTLAASARQEGNSWIHVGPLDGPVSSGQVWSIAREAQRTTARR